LRGFERALRGEDRERLADRVHRARFQRAGEQMRPRSQRDTVDDAPAVAHGTVGVDLRVLGHAQHTVRAVQPPAAVVRQIAVAVARERAAARGEFADAEGAVAEQR
jgi:hypothetical protein